MSEHDRFMRRAIEQAQDYGIEVDIWKIEGVDDPADAQMLVEQGRKGEGREGVVCVVLGRGASDDKVDEWLRAGAPIEGYIGFAIGRSIWWDALKGYLDSSLSREDAANQVAGEGAMIFGDVGDPNSEIVRVLRSRHSLQRRPHLGTQPHVFYLV